MKLIYHIDDICLGRANKRCWQQDALLRHTCTTGQERISRKVYGPATLVKILGVQGLGYTRTSLNKEWILHLLPQRGKYSPW